MIVSGRLQGLFISHQCGLSSVNGFQKQPLQPTPSVVESPYPIWSGNYWSHHWESAHSAESSELYLLRLTEAFLVIRRDDLSKGSIQLACEYAGSIYGLAGERHTLFDLHGSWILTRLWCMQSSASLQNVLVYCSARIFAPWIKNVLFAAELVAFDANRGCAYKHPY